MDTQAKPHPDLQGVTVLQLVPSLDAGGAERTAVDVAAALVAAGARAIVASSGGRLVPELQQTGAEWLPFPAATKNPVRIFWNAERIRRLIGTEHVDLVHARSRAPAWSGLMAARRAGVPFVTTYHGAYKAGGALKTWYNSVMARGDAVIANSRFTAGLIEAQHPQARGRIEVIYRGTDLARFDAAAVSRERIAGLRAAWGVPPERRIVLLPARLTGWKGQAVLIDAAAIIAERGVVDVDYVLAGDAQGRTDYVAALEARITSHGLDGRVRIVGHCADMPAANLAADVVAVPSTEPEAFGRTAVEAQAAGRPVVVSDLGATPETVLAHPECAADARTGWRVPPGDAVALADALAEALSLTQHQRAALGARARERARAFGLEAMTSATLALYGRLLRRESTD